MVAVLFFGGLQRSGTRSILHEKALHEQMAPMAPVELPDPIAQMLSKCQDWNNEPTMLIQMPGSAGIMENQRRIIPAMNPRRDSRLIHSTTVPLSSMAHLSISEGPEDTQTSNPNPTKPLKPLRKNRTLKVESSFTPKSKPKMPKNRPKYTALHTSVLDARKKSTFHGDTASSASNSNSIPFFERHHEEHDMDEELNHFFKKGTAVRRRTMQMGKEAALWKPNAFNNISLPTLEDNTPY
jgi:hypothetical protein